MTMKRQRKVIRISDADWQAFSNGKDLPDKVVEKMEARLLELAARLPVTALDHQELFRRVADYLLGRILISGYDISPLLADPPLLGPFKRTRKGGPKGKFKADIEEAIQLIDRRPAGQSKAKAVEPIVNRLAAGGLARARKTKSLLDAVKWRSHPRRR